MSQTYNRIVWILFNAFTLAEFGSMHTH